MAKWLCNMHIHKSFGTIQGSITIWIYVLPTFMVKNTQIYRSQCSLVLVVLKGMPMIEILRTEEFFIYKFEFKDCRIAVEEEVFLFSDL